jgi:putative transposase
MPRKPRFTLPGVPQHVIQRGNNRQPCFFAEVDYRRYLDDLHASAEHYACRLHAYVLMTNHVHVLLTPMREYGIGEMMQALGRRYVYYINKTYARTGTLWEGRFKASLVDSEAYLLTCMRYIELNPVRADMVNHAGEYPWSSYGANAQDRTDALLSPHPLYTALGMIREALNHELVLGRSYFKDKIEAMTKRQTRLGIPGRPRVEEPVGVYYID